MSHLTRIPLRMWSFRYVSNLNKRTALALAETASPTQAPVLFDFIDRYLKFETSISVNINVS